MFFSAMSEELSFGVKFSLLRVTEIKMVGLLQSSKVFVLHMSSFVSFPRAQFFLSSIDSRNIQGGFFDWSALKMTK